MPSDNNAVIQDLVKDFDKNACDWCNEYKRKGLSRSSRVLLNYIPDEGLTGKSVLDLGSGPGAFALETLKLGASSSVGVDLSAGMINVANDLAQNLGVGDQAKFEVGNAATAQLPVSDIVVMDKMICCYPDVDPLLEKAVAASQHSVGFIVPRDQGLLKIGLRIGYSSRI